MVSFQIGDWKNKSPNNNLTAIRGCQLTLVSDVTMICSCVFLGLFSEQMMYSVLLFFFNRPSNHILPVWLHGSFVHPSPPFKKQNILRNHKRNAASKQIFEGKKIKLKTKSAADGEQFPFMQDKQDKEAGPESSI